MFFVANSVKLHLTARKIVTPKESHMSVQTGHKTLLLFHWCVQQVVLNTFQKNVDCFFFFLSIHNLKF